MRDKLLSDELLKTKEDIKLKNKELKVLKESVTENPSINRLSLNSKGFCYSFIK